MEKNNNNKLLTTLKLNVSYKHNFSKLSKRSIQIMDAWGLTDKKVHNIIYDFEFKLVNNSIYYICGYSGSGKSSLLLDLKNQLTEKLPFPVTYITNYRDVLLSTDEQERRLIDFFPEVDQNTRLKMMSKCGIIEAWKYITFFKDLSDGEKFRFILYYFLIQTLTNNKKAVHGSIPHILIFDEFCSTLDRITAKTIAQNVHKVRKILNENGKSIIMVFASAHDDLIPYINADYVYFKEFHPSVKEYQQAVTKQ
jgi:ABC-type ATPase with predicted acetyltransferase domain